MSEELKPCPFCGDTPGGDSHTLTQGFKYGAIECGCSAIGPDVRTGYEDWPAWKDAAISAWNERAELAALKAGQGEAVAEVISAYGDPEAFGERKVKVPADLRKIPYGTKLYTAPPASADVVSVPAELLKRVCADRSNGPSYAFKAIEELRALLARSESKKVNP